MWLYLPWSESIKKRACRYLLQRYLGNFLEEKLTLDQLSVDLYNGTGTVSDVSLDCEALNELGDSQSWPLEIVDGHMKEITVTIPWSTLLKDDSVVEVNGLSVTVQPKVRAEPASSMLESMWSSMSSSMQLAEECLREEEGAPQDSRPVEGIEMFAHAIDSILSKVKVKFVNTKIRIEHVPKNGERGIALEIHIQNIDYFDEAGTEPAPDVTDAEKNKTYVVATYTNKKIKFQGVTLYTDEYPSKLRTMARSLIMEKSSSSQSEKSDTHIDTSEINYQSTASDVFYETRSVLSTLEADPIKEVIEDRPQTEFIRDATPEEKNNQPDPILFAKLTGHQELALKVKRTEEVEGPKVEVKMLLGSFVFFISPRQLHTLIELVNALNQPHLEDTSNIPLRPNGGNVLCKPMKQHDYQLIEAQLLGNLEDPVRPSTMHGWSGPSVDDSDTDSDRFHPMTSVGNQMAESFSSSVSSTSTSMNSSINTASGQPRITRNKKVPHIDGDPTAQVSHISFRISSLSCVLLHKDILASTPMGIEHLSPQSVYRMQDAAKEFFDSLVPFYIADSGNHFQSANEAIDRATDRNHLRLITSELTLDGSEKVTSHGSQTHCEAAIKHILFSECLYTMNEGEIVPETFDLIRFDSCDEEDSNRKSGSRSNMKISFKQTCKYVRMSGEKKLVYPTTDISIKLMPVTIDIELTVIERAWVILFGAVVPPQTQGPQAPSTHVNVSVHCPIISAVLRFPIADLRPGATRDIRRVRPDYLVFHFQNASVTSQKTPSTRPLPTLVTLKTTTLDLYYYENESLPGTHIARSTMADMMEGDVLKGTSLHPLPTISMTFQPAKPPKGPFDSLVEEPHFEPVAAQNPMTTSMYMMHNLQSDGPSPFSGKKMAHQSFTQHENSPQGQEEELIVPGSEEEMTEFTNSSVEHSAIHLDFNLPVLSLQLESKQLYEILYNRINSDLLLWEPQIVDPFEISPLMTGTIYPAFNEFKGTGYDSESETSSSEDENLYYSTYDNKVKKGIIRPAPEKKDEHNFCLTLKVAKGLLTILAPFRDSNKRVLPGQMGELVLEARKLSMCEVSGLHGQPKSAQLCLRAGKTTLYHDSQSTIPSEKPDLRFYGSPLPANLKKTIYPSGRGVFLNNVAAKDMFSLALKVDPDGETPNLKTICIALGIEQATLRHRGDKGITWLTQLMDVIDVIDFPVAGYTPSTVLSELHVHVWDCAIDYRPLYLPIRSIVTLGNFSVSSNLIAETNTSCLRFLAQECTLFLSTVNGHNPNKPIPIDDDKLPDLNKDYVCVIYVGLFELSLRMEDKTSSSEQPQVDLSASNNMVEIHTCWDSASSLCRLLTYLACEGDSQLPIVPSSRHTSICSETLDQLVGLDDPPIEEIREISPNQLQQCTDLLAEAMKESPNSTLDEDELNSSTEKDGAEIFFFPDESIVKKPFIETEDGHQIDIEEFLPGFVEDAVEAVPSNEVTNELGDPTATPKAAKKGKRKKQKSTGDSSNTDDEFCIIVSSPCNEDKELEEPGVGWSGCRPAHAQENHFAAPATRADVLKAPKSFPTPIVRYTLCEMSITWNMYGGADFKPTEVSSQGRSKKSVTIKEQKPGSPATNKRTKDYEPYETRGAITAAYKKGVSWSANSEKVKPAPPPLPILDPKSRGGPSRDHHTCVKLCLTKMKFQHETYAPGGMHASRQTLAISRIEVLDRLVCSEINKFLSQLNREDEPERNNAHMLIVKAVHLRPQASVAAQECCLKVSMLPLRFNIDQDTLQFIVAFFTKFGTDDFNEEKPGSEASPRHCAPPRPPVMGVAARARDPPPTPTSLGDLDALSLNEHVIRNVEPLLETFEAERLVSTNLIQLEEDFQRLAVSQDKPAAKPVPTQPNSDEPLYFRRVVFSPEVPIRLDYMGKRVDLSTGPVTGLVMGLGHLNCSELKLKRLDYRLGLLGLEKLVQWALHEWLSDIKRNQLPGLLGGIGPMHSVLQLLQGIRDLVWLPLEQWRRDGRLVLGLRRGAASFTARTAVAALDITTRLLHLIQATAETAFDMLTPGPTLALQEVYHRRQRRRRRDPSRHPADIREGVATAYNTVREGFADTASTMALAARSESGASAGVAVLRQLPGAAVAPLALAAAGAADLLGGVRAHLAPHAQRDHRDKWRADHR